MNGPNVGNWGAGRRVGLRGRAVNWKGNWLLIGQLLSQGPVLKSPGLILYIHL